tara:strand:- start:65 stop:331 length:267 start_codon:yes stop_codon:yes gene_type:complete
MSKKEEKTDKRIEKKVLTTYVYNDIAEFVAVAAEELGINKTGLASELVEIIIRDVMDIMEQYRCTIKEAFLMWNFHKHQSFDFSQYRY